MGAHMAALAEGMALAERCDLDQVTLLEVIIKIYCFVMYTPYLFCIIFFGFLPFFAHFVEKIVPSQYTP